MKPAAVIALLGLAIAYQLLALPVYRVGGVAPDFVFVSLLYVALRQSTGVTLFLGLVLATILDPLSIDPAGAHAAGFVPVLLVVGRCRHWAVLKSAVCRCVVVFPAALMAWRQRR